MTWFSKMTGVCAIVILLGFSLEVLGYTLFMCKQDCKDEPDDPVCSRWNFTTDDRPPRKASDYMWVRNECERKCLAKGIYERVADMELCYKHGQNRTVYICSRYKRHPRRYEQCWTNETWRT